MYKYLTIFILILINKYIILKELKVFKYIFKFKFNCDYFISFKENLSIFEL